MAISCEIRSLARPVLEGITPGDEVIIVIPGDQPFNRIAYQTIGGLAHSLWGAGMYRLRMERGSSVVFVRRLDAGGSPRQVPVRQTTGSCRTMNDLIGDLAMSDKKAEEPRWTIRGVRQEARERAIKAAELTDKSVGEWISEKLLAGWESDRAQTRMPAVITPPVTDLVAKPVANSANSALDVSYHLEVLDAVIRFAHDSMTEPVRQAADRVIIDHLKELRVRRPRRTKRADGPTEPPKLSDETD